MSKPEAKPALQHPLAQQAESKEPAGVEASVVAKGELPFTGVELTNLVFLGLLLIGLGSALLMWSRRPAGQ
jgi:uncharacterized surface anchored protein